MITKLLNKNFIDLEHKKNINKNKVDSFRNTELVSSKQFSVKEKIKIVIEGQSAKITIDQICAREGITPSIFYQWTNDCLTVKKIELKDDTSSFIELSQEDKFRMVIEVKSGEISVAELCRREDISQDTFLEWNQVFIEARKNNLQKISVRNFDCIKNKEIISTYTNKTALSYIENYIDLSTDKVIIDSGNVDLNKFDSLDSVIGLKRINNIRHINKYFEEINSKLIDGGIFIGCLETFSARRNRMKINSIPVINNIYFIFEFLVKRILPKLSFSKKYYFNFTKGNDRLLSKAEALGRLVSCGFSIMDYRSIEGVIYYVVKKVKEPSFDMSPSYGPVYKMPRLGKNGKIIGVYKFRTMHPYSEYLQDYILKANGYANSGKPADDFRIPVWAKFMRKYWLDELPQLLNVLKGELKLVGIRPVSKRYFEDIPKEMQKLRLTQKPGCIPPYVALNKEGNVMSVLQAEKQYLEDKIKNPYFTDSKYFIYAVINIVFKNKRSA